MNRKQMMENCPEEFKDELGNIIDDIEAKVCDAAGLICIDSIDRIGDIAEAYYLLNRLAKDLY